MTANDGIETSGQATVDATVKESIQLNKGVAEGKLVVISIDATFIGCLVVAR